MAFIHILFDIEKLIRFAFFNELRSCEDRTCRMLVKKSNVPKRSKILVSCLSLARSDDG